MNAEKTRTQRPDPGDFQFELPVPFAPKAPRKRAPRKVAAAPSPSPVSSPAELPLSAAEPAKPRRRRLAKAFDRPLDKVLMKEAVAAVPVTKQKLVTVRDRFTFSKIEHDRLVELKKQLAEQGLTVKKSDLVRVGLLLALSISPEKLKSLLGRLPPAG